MRNIFTTDSGSSAAGVAGWRPDIVFIDGLSFGGFIYAVGGSVAGRGKRKTIVLIIILFYIEGTEGGGGGGVVETTYIFTGVTIPYKTVVSRKRTKKWRGNIRVGRRRRWFRRRLVTRFLCILFTVRMRPPDETRRKRLDEEGRNRIREKQNTTNTADNGNRIIFRGQNDSVGYWFYPHRLRNGLDLFPFWWFQYDESGTRTGVITL